MRAGHGDGGAIRLKLKFLTGRLPLALLVAIIHAGTEFRDLRPPLLDLPAHRIGDDEGGFPNAGVHVLRSDVPGLGFGERSLGRSRAGDGLRRRGHGHAGQQNEDCKKANERSTGT